MNEKAVWSPYVGKIAWPTLALTAFVVAGVTTVWWAASTGRIGMPAGFALNAVLAYLAFTPLHEASHGNVGERGLGKAVGWLMGAVLLAPFPAFRVLHLRHHSSTNHPEKDPDMWVAGSGLAVLFRCATILPHYYRCFLVGDASSTKGARDARRSVIAGMIAIVGVIGVATVSGFGTPVLLLWVLPAWVASTVLAFFFDWVPHHPHDVQGRYRDTRAIVGRAWEVVLLGQSLHLVHHLYPRVPFYRYGTVFRTLRSELERRGAPIVDRHDARGGESPRKGERAD